jgi:hypothetical protein
MQCAWCTYRRLLQNSIFSYYQKHTQVSHYQSAHKSPIITPCPRLSVWVRRTVLYKNCSNMNKYFGNGFTYGGRLEDDSSIDRSNICERLDKGEFDIVIYGKVGKQRRIQPVTTLPYWNTVSKNMNQERITFLYGGDRCRDLSKNRMDEDIVHHLKYGTCFVREGKNRNIDDIAH